MNKHIQYLKSYQLVKLIYIYAYLFEIYKSYKKHLEKQAVSAYLAAKEKIINTESAEPKQKTASGNFFTLLPFSLRESHPESKTALRFLPLLFYDSRQMDLFTSVDPIINKAEALVNPQLWNLYSYCKNNPISYFDPDGRLSILSGLFNFTKGVVKTGINTVKGVFHVATHPVQTVKGVFNAVTHPVDTFNSIKSSVEKTIHTFKNADESTQAEMIGKFFGEVGLSLVGAKGLGKIKIQKYKHGGGGLNVINNGERLFGIDIHGFKLKGVQKTRVHYHRGKTKSQKKKHRPYQGGW